MKAKLFVKRLFDVVASGVGLLLLSPIFMFIAIWIKKDSYGPVFYRQIRVGKDGVNFKIHKFRSMRTDADKSGQLTIGNDSRITNSGKFLRKYKLDELAQLIDVFIGTMSLVGPRPEVPEFMDLYPHNERKLILSVKPGITDKASIEMVDENEILGKYVDPRQAYVDVIMPMKAKYYIDYAENHSFSGDIKLIFQTILKIITR